ncbi:mechanosensitive ion channel domain-containing protein [Dolichospermum flos-aquae]|uniref:Mechanosensitive ion channel n=1 Tax=Dolichospermum flos-aquae LEGE 04289 TaxID=1828708 RepID=A0ACC5Q0Z6_DOLFA|nr:mechanosensitive ion channel domain-containing protein [Dolichospermum flos-aquae]MBE9218754.1 mechanosensitive ion channel [Dolichospermum flos-aquae LEGE 04289]
MKNFLVLFQVALTGCLLFAYVVVLNNPQQVFPIVLYGLKIAVLISISMVIVNAVSFLLINFWLTRKKRTRPSRLLKLIISVFLYLICIFIILRILGQETTMFFTTSALFTAIVGFAMQEPLGNFLSGVFLQINQPFQIGDQIQFQGLEGIVVEGVVESIDWNSTDIRLNSGEITYIPNGLIAKELVKMIDSGSVYRTVDFTISAKVPPNQVMDTACKAVINQPLPNINLDKPVFVRMWSYGLEEVNYKLFYYPKNYSEAENHTDPEIRCRIWYTLSRTSMGSEYQSTENERLLQLVSNIEFFRNLTVEAQSLLVEHSKTLLFDADELLDYQHLLSPAMFLVVRGCVAIEQKLVPNLETVTFKPVSRQPQNHNQSSYALKPIVIEQVASALAKYIGPVAFSLTYQTAKEVSSLYWLYASLAAEIENIDQRQEFLGYQPDAPTEKFLIGDFFGEMNLFLGEPLPSMKIITVEDTEILALTPAAVANALHHDGISINTMSQYIAQYHHNYLSGTLQEVSSRILNQNGISEQMQEHLEPYFRRLLNPLVTS